MRMFDCVVIGSGPAGQRAAIQAAKLGRSVCIIEKNDALGGAAINTGTIPSKTLREAVLHLTGAAHIGLFGERARVKRHITVEDLLHVSRRVIQHERRLVREHLDHNGVELIHGAARFMTPDTVEVDRGDESELVGGAKFIIATGTRPARPASVPFDDRTIVCSDTLLTVGALPHSMIVVGGGVVGTEYACMMAALGVKVTLVEGRDEVLGFLDREIVEALMYQMRRNGITLRLGERVRRIETLEQHASAFNEPRVQAVLESGKALRAASLLYAVGRQGTAGALDLDRAGLATDVRDRLRVNERLQTAVPHIYAVGDVIGFPSLASTAMEQGRLAACHAFGAPAHSVPGLLPFGIFAIPEVSMVGKTEAQLTEAGIPYESGVAQYSELARGQLLGDEDGLLKLLIQQDSHEILGVHVIGSGATELVHIGQTAMSFRGTVEFFVNNVFNYPTLAEAYKVAALNGLNKIRHV